MNNSASIIVLLMLAGIFMLLMVRVCRESERVALNSPRRFVKLVGPGLFLRLPVRVSPYEYTRVRVGDTGTYIADGWGEIHGQHMPVFAANQLATDQAFSVQAFVNQRIFVVAAGGARG